MLVSTSNSVILGSAMRPLNFCSSTSSLCSSSENSTPCLTGSSEMTYICLSPKGSTCLKSIRMVFNVLVYMCPPYHREKSGGDRSQRPWRCHEDQTMWPLAGKWYEIGWKTECKIRIRIKICHFNEFVTNLLYWCEPLVLLSRNLSLCEAPATRQMDRCL